jgi:branched-chain amino acid transport system permease protein
MVNHLIDGILLGGLYTGIALGLTLVFGVMKMVNLAQGAILIGAAYLAYAVSTLLHLDPLVSLLILMPLMFFIAYAVQWVVLNPLMKRGPETLLVATFGIMLITQTALALIFGNDPRTLNAPYTITGITILGDRVRTVYVIAFVAAALMVGTTSLALKRLRFGKALRAAAEDPIAAASVGVNVPLVYAVTFGLAAALSAVGGTLIGLSYGFDPTTGDGWLLRSFTVIVLGGMGSLGGAFLGGILVGVIEEVAASIIGAQFRDLIVFAFLVFILLIRPQGLFGKKVSV